MSNRDVVLEAVRDLPEGVTFDEILERIAILAAIQRGEEASAAGHVIPHEELKKRVARWTSS